MNKVLHVIEGFNTQAIERWLYMMMQHFNKAGKKIDWTFYSVLGQAGTMDETIRELGGKIIYSPVHLRQTLKFVIALRRALVSGRYDVLHSHHDLISAVYLLAATGIPLKKRIVHVHNTSLSLPIANPVKNFLLREPMRRACLDRVDHVVGVSAAALDAFLRGRERKLGRDHVIHCGIDMVPFQKKPPSRVEFRQSLGLPSDSKVLLFVGRMIEYKNPCFVIEVLAHLSKLAPNVCAIFSGAGPLEDMVRKMAEQRSLAGRVRVLGWQDDIPKIMQSCDLLIWPGLEEPKEGLGLAIVEAQAAGLPVLMSLNVPEEAIVVPELIDVLPLAAGAAIWADRVMAALNRTHPEGVEALAKVADSTFSISRSAANIASLYQ